MALIEELDPQFADNPDPRCPLVLVLDTSSSMCGERLDGLNAGLRILKDELMKDTLAARRVEVAVITFDSRVQVVQEFVTAGDWTPPTLSAQYRTHMGEAVLKALDMIDERKASYKQNAVDYYRPWVFLITDGAPQGEPEEAFAEATRRIHAAEEKRQVAFFAVGVEEADMQKLAQLSVRTPLKLTGLNFGAMFVWLSKSTQAVSHSGKDDQVALPAVGWGTV